MRQRYVLIEPKYSDPDTFCAFTIGSQRVRSSIDIYANLWQLEGVANALLADSWKEEGPLDVEHTEGDCIFGLQVTVLPHDGGSRTVRFRVFQEYLDDAALFRADIRFELSPREAGEFARELKDWCANPDFPFLWKGD